MRIGIIGTGSMGAAHSSGWASALKDPALGGSFSLDAMLEHTPGSASALAESYGLAVYRDLDAFLKVVDIVDVCAPTHLHHRFVLAAAAAGKEVVCEKPLARTLAQAREMIETCNREGVSLFPAQVLRFFPEYAGARQMVLSGELGSPAVMRFSRCTFTPAKSGENWFTDFDKSGGMVLDLMIHDLDFARWIAGPVKSVYAKRLLPRNTGIPGDHALIILEHESGTITHAEGSWAYPAPGFHTSFEIAGSNGLLTFDSGETAALTFTPRTLPGAASPGIPAPASPLAEDPYAAQLHRFAEALRTGAPPPVTAEEGYEALRLALTALASAEQNRALAPLEAES